VPDRQHTVDMPTNPTPSTWTLKFKQHKTTILLHVEKTQTFTSIKTELLSALQETRPDGVLNGIPIPQDPEAVIFARQIIDPDTAETTWESLDDDMNGDLFDEKSAGKGKNKTKAKTAGGIRDCPIGAGLKDGSNVAFAFLDEEARAATLEMGALGDKREWDVVLPTYEDVYGVEGLEPDPE